MKNYGITHFEAYLDFISTIIGCAPNQFPKEDFYTNEEQLDLEKSFRLLDWKFPLVEERLRDQDLVPELRRLIQASLEAYRQDDDIKGAHLIQDFEALILTNARRGRT